MILAGDIGGTKVNIALFEENDDGLTLVEEARFESRRYGGLEEILREFCRKKHAKLKHAGFGIAGPVIEGRCEVTNLPWVVDVQNLKREIGLDSVWLLNDLGALACAIPFLGEHEVEVLQKGSGKGNGRIAVVAAGTGLGEAFLFPDPEGRFFILDSEGGHCDFAPRSELESELLLFLTGKFGRVSYERVLSGPGLHNIYQFVMNHFSWEEPDWLTEEFRAGDPGVVITQNGLNKKSPACEKSLEMFVSLYGAVAGNLGLQFLAAGGVYVGGGIAPKIISLIRQNSFMTSFLNKGRFRTFLEQVPVKVIINEKASLYGAARYAKGEKFAR